MTPRHLADAEPFTLAEVDLPAMLLDAELPSLLPALAQLTGDMSLVRAEFRPAINATPLGLEPQGGLSARTQQLARDAPGHWRLGRPWPTGGAGAGQRTAACADGVHHRRGRERLPVTVPASARARGHPRAGRER